MIKTWGWGIVCVVGLSAQLRVAAGPPLTDDVTSKPASRPASQPVTYSKPGEYYWVEERPTVGKVALDAFVGSWLKPLASMTTIGDREWVEAKLNFFIVPTSVSSTPSRQDAIRTIQGWIEGASPEEAQRIYTLVVEETVRYLSVFKEKEIQNGSGKLIDNPYFKLYRGEISSEVWLNAIHNLYPRSLAILVDSALKTKFPNLSAEDRARIVERIKNPDPSMGEHPTINSQYPDQLTPLIASFRSQILPKSIREAVLEAAPYIAVSELDANLKQENPNAIKKLDQTAHALFGTSLQTELQQKFEALSFQPLKDNSKQLKDQFTAAAIRVVYPLMVYGGIEEQFMTLFPQGIPPTVRDGINRMHQNIQECISTVTRSSNPTPREVKACIVSELFRYLRANAKTIITEVAQQKFRDPDLVKVLASQESALFNCLSFKTSLNDFNDMARNAFSMWSDHAVLDRNIRLFTYDNFIRELHLSPSKDRDPFSQDKELKDRLLKIMADCLDEVMSHSVVGTVELVVSKNPWLKEKKYEAFLEILKKHPLAFVNMLKREGTFAPTTQPGSCPQEPLIDANTIQQLGELQKILNNIIDADQELFLKKAAELQAYFAAHPKDADVQKMVDLLATPEVREYIAIAVLNDRVAASLKNIGGLTGLGIWIGTTLPEGWGGLKKRIYQHDKIDLTYIFNFDKTPKNGQAKEEFSEAEKKMLSELRTFILKRVEELTNLKLSKERRDQIVVEIHDEIIRKIYEKDPKDFPIKP